MYQISITISQFEILVEIKDKGKSPPSSNCAFNLIYYSVSKEKSFSGTSLHCHHFDSKNYLVFQCFCRSLGVHIILVCLDFENVVEIS